MRVLIDLVGGESLIIVAEVVATLEMDGKKKEKKSSREKNWRKKETRVEASKRKQKLEEELHGGVSESGFVSYR